MRAGVEGEKGEKGRPYEGTSADSGNLYIGR